ncbi:MAG TPA: ABC transporter ATP-binding protein [Eubacteriales bacterium]|nr:ABC transporter ATP-binding protein [Eubacteriales bacterium]
MISYAYMKILKEYLKPYTGKIIVIALLYALSILAMIITPKIMSNIITFGIAVQDMHYIWTRGLLMIAIATPTLLIILVISKLKADLTTGYIADLRKGIFKKINSLTAEEFASKGTASLLTRSTDDTWFMQEVVGQIIYVLVSTPLLFIGGIVMTFIADWILALIMLGISPIILFFIWLINRRLFGLYDNSEKYMDIQNKVMRERLKGLRVIRAFNKEPYEHERVSDATKTMAVYIIKANVLTSIVQPISAFLLNIATVLILYFGAMRIQTSVLLTAGDVIATIQYIALIMSSLMMGSALLLYMPKIKVTLNRLGEIFAMEGSEADAEESIKLAGDIKIENMDFCYPDSQTPVLKNINVDVQNGQVVGIIGGTGSGKTTLMKLLMGFYRPNEGNMYIGGKSVFDLNAGTIRDNASIALQKAMIFRGTIEDNIKMGNQNATEEQIKEAAEISQLKELISGNADGLKHELTQAGGNISGGQKQRINIARTIIKDASIFIFDDSFSALDYLTESKLRKKVNKYLSGKTQLIVTQRAATAMRCDKIYVMDKGEIVGSGAHEDLLKTCPIYKEIYDSQLGGVING